MPRTPRTSLLRRLMGRPAPRAAQDQDAGDMGTAFALDYSLDQAPLGDAASRLAKVPAAAPWPLRRRSKTY